MGRPGRVRGRAGGQRDPHAPPDRPPRAVRRPAGRLRHGPTDAVPPGPPAPRRDGGRAGSGRRRRRGVRAAGLAGRRARHCLLVLGREAGTARRVRRRRDGEHGDRGLQPPRVGADRGARRRRGGGLPGPGDVAGLHPVHPAGGPGGDVRRHHGVRGGHRPPLRVDPGAGHPGLRRLDPGGSGAPGGRRGPRRARPGGPRRVSAVASARSRRRAGGAKGLRQGRGGPRRRRALTPRPVGLRAGNSCSCNDVSNTDHHRRTPMPAITVENITALPRVPATDPAASRLRRVRTVTTAPSGLEGEGFPVRRAFMGVDLAELDPFVHMDQMGEVEYAPGEPKGTPWHPHRGFETVTYMIDGVFRHQDSNGGGGLITNGDTQWMTAGGGILHIEAPPEELVRSGGLFHGFQLWVNLPARLKMTQPRYQDIRAGQVALLTSRDGGALLRVIAGELAGHKGPGITHTPITVVHATVSPGAQVRLPWRPDFNALGYVLAGNGTVGAERRPVRTGQLAVFGPGGSITFGAAERQQGPGKDFDLLLLGGEPIREPVAAYGPFVMNTRDELVKAFEDYQAGRLGSIPAEPRPIPAEPRPGHDVL